MSATQARNARAANEQRTTRAFERLRASPPRLTAFLRRMPKGGDIHNHLAGAIYAETLIEIAADAGFCVDRATLELSPAPCSPTDGRPPVAAAREDDDLRDAIIDAWSMRGFVPGTKTAHDHFFNTFNLYWPLINLAKGRQLADVVARAAVQNVLYLELMDTTDQGLAVALGEQVGWDSDLDALRDRLLAAGMDGLVEKTRAFLDQQEAEMRARLACGTPTADRGCDVTIRYLHEVVRDLPPAQVFAQILLGFELAKADPRVVGLNLVSPEDAYISVRDYALHMAMIAALNRHDPSVNVALHAGELSLGLVPPSVLGSHIRQAVEAGARRIGHGLDLMYEDDPDGLLATMAARPVAVEICLTSNAQTLAIEGDEHPFPIYRAAGVPVTLATDDEGVSRIDLTHEYRRAALTYALSYADLKELARTSIEHAFLPGPSLWQDGRVGTPIGALTTEPLGGDTPSDACRSLLAASEKAATQWRLEARFAAFEEDVARRDQTIGQREG